MNELYTNIIAERDRRLAEGEDRDPCCVLADELESGMEIPKHIVDLIWSAHHGGPWVIGSKQDLRIFSEYCTKAGTPLQLRIPSEVVCRIPVYRDDHGDCVFTESANGESFAVWTRKGRVYVGFEFARMAELFRALRPMYSMEATGNRHVGMVVLENADNEDTIFQVCCDLIEAKNRFNE